MKRARRPSAGPSASSRPTAIRQSSTSTILPRSSWPSASASSVSPTRRTAGRRWPSTGAPAGADHQPPPPPPPPPPPEKPPPPDPLLLPGAVEAELIVLASEDPTPFTKLVGLSHGLPLPAYQ